MGKCVICGELTLGYEYCNECWENLENEDPEWINADGEGKRSRQTGDY